MTVATVQLRAANGAVSSIQVTLPISSSFVFPDATSRPHMVTGSVMAYTDTSGPQTVTLKPLPAKNSTFGVDATTGAANNGTFYDGRGWVNVTKANTRIDGYDFNGVGVGNIQANNVFISRCWFRNIDGEDSWGVWCHQNGTFTNLTITDCLVSGTSATKTGPNGILKQDGTISNVVIRRCHTVNCSGFVQFAPIVGPGNAPYGNVIAECYMEVNSDPSNLGLHLEQVNVSSGTGGLLIQNNHITGPTRQTATIYICHDSGNVGNITIDNNLLDGKPQNTIYAGNTGQAQGVLISAAGNVKVTNNKFATTNGQNPGGLLIDPGSGDARLLVSGNVSYPALSPLSI